MGFHVISSEKELDDCVVEVQGLNAVTHGIPCVVCCRVCLSSPPKKRWRLGSVFDLRVAMAAEESQGSEDPSCVSCGRRHCTLDVAEDVKQETSAFG